MLESILKDDKKGNALKTGRTMLEGITTSTPKESITGNLEEVLKEISDAGGTIQGIERRQEDSNNEENDESGGEDSKLVQRNG